MTNIESIADLLFVEITLLSILLLVLALYNNLVLYKISIKDKLSLAVVAFIAVIVSECFWHFADRMPEYRILNCACAYTFATLFTMGTSLFCQFSLERFDIKLASRKVYALLFYVPVVIVILSCLLTPWFEILYWFDGNGEIQYADGYDYFFVPLGFAYGFAPSVLALYYLILSKKKETEKKFYARTILLTSVLMGSIEVLELFVLQIDESYIVSGIAAAFALFFFSTNVNTKKFVKNREQIASVESDLAVAAHIQLGALPAVENALAEFPQVKVYAGIKPAKEVGGDFYDFFQIDKTHVCFVIADVSGKGVPAALFMMTAKTMIKDHASMMPSTAQVFTEVNRLLCENNPEDMFATAWIGILDTETGVMKCTNAGHCAPCFAKKDGSFEFLEQRHGTFLAGFDETRYKESEIRFEDGDCLLLYTDGLTEAHNESNELYGEKRLLDKVNSIEARGTEPFIRQIEEDVARFSEGTEPFDDVTMMTIKWNG